MFLNVIKTFLVFRFILTTVVSNLSYCKVIYKYNTLIQRQSDWHHTTSVRSYRLIARAREKFIEIFSLGNFWWIFGDTQPILVYWASLRSRPLQSKITCKYPQYFRSYNKFNSYSFLIYVWVGYSYILPVLGIHNIYRGTQ